jgi:hypothetical protein
MRGDTIAPHFLWGRKNIGLNGTMGENCLLAAILGKVIWNVRLSIT